MSSRWSRAELFRVSRITAIPAGHAFGKVFHFFQRRNNALQGQFRPSAHLFASRAFECQPFMISTGSISPAGVNPKTFP